MGQSGVLTPLTALCNFDNFLYPTLLITVVLLLLLFDNCEQMLTDPGKP